MGYSYGHIHPGLPPDPPELPEGADPSPRWPAWYAPVGFVVAFAATLAFVIVLAILAAIAGADLDEESAVLTVVGTLIQAAVLVGTAVFLASRTRAPRAWHFGLRRTRLWPAVGWAALGMFSFYVFSAVYTVALDPEAEQTVAEDLGADEGTLALIAAGVVVIAVAPIAEEVFFRGFFYRALRGRLGVLAAAGIDGAVFGAIHFTGADTLEVLPILAMLGFVFCLVYERTGSLYPVIALHALNNSIAFIDATSDESAVVSAVLGTTTIAACVLAPRLAPGRRAPALR